MRSVIVVVLGLVGSGCMIEERRDTPPTNLPDAPVEPPRDPLFEGEAVDNLEAIAASASFRLLVDDPCPDTTAVPADVPEAYAPYAPVDADWYGHWDCVAWRAPQPQIHWQYRYVEGSELCAAFGCEHDAAYEVIASVDARGDGEVSSLWLYGWDDAGEWALSDVQAHGQF